MAKQGRCQGSRGGYVCWQPVLADDIYCADHRASRDQWNAETREHFEHHTKTFVAGCLRCETERDFPMPGK